MSCSFALVQTPALWDLKSATPSVTQAANAANPRRRMRCFECTEHGAARNLVGDSVGDRCAHDQCCHPRAELVGVKPAIDHLWSLAPRGPNHGGYAARRRHVLASQGAAAAARARGAASASAKDAARSVNSQTWMKPRDGHQGVRWESRAAQQLRSTMAGAHRLRHPAHFEEPTTTPTSAYTAQRASSLGRPQPCGKCLHVPGGLPSPHPRGSLS